jgi:CBS domain-containing protein
MPARSRQPASPPALTRLLVPLDGSSLAEQALDAAQALASNGAILTLLRVVPPVERAMRGVGAAGTYVDRAATRRAVAEAEEYLRGVARTIPQPRLSVRTVVRVGRPSTEILAAARECSVDLIMLSTHARPAPQRWVLGSVADELVRRSGTPVFLLSARAVAAHLSAPFAVQDVMTADVVAVRVDEPVSTVLRKLLRRRISGAPVVNAAGTLAGVVSEHDLLAWQQQLVETVGKGGPAGADPSVRRPQDVPVGRVMSHPPVAIEESAPLQAAIHLLLERQLQRLPVTRDGRLVGILSRADVLRAIADQWDVRSADTAGASRSQAAPVP